MLSVHPALTRVLPPQTPLKMKSDLELLCNSGPGPWARVLSSAGIQRNCCPVLLPPHSVAADPLLQEPAPGALPFDWIISSNIDVFMWHRIFLLIIWSLVCFFFSIALSAVQSMDHSFDGISIKMEEGAYQRKANTWNFRQILQFLRKGIMNETKMHCLFNMWLLLSVQCSETSGRVKIPSWSETPRATQGKIHPSHFKYWDIMPSICAKVMTVQVVLSVPAALAAEGNSELP